MKFDLFDALNLMDNYFGSDGEILLTQDKDKIEVRLRVFNKDNLYNSAFAISKVEINDSFVGTMNFRFNIAIKELQEVIKSKN